jgi:hypothetical protein
MDKKHTKPIEKKKYQSIRNNSRNMFTENQQCTQLVAKQVIQEQGPIKPQGVHIQRALKSTQPEHKDVR